MEKAYLYVILLPQMDEELNLGYMIKFGYSKDFEDRMKTGYNAYHRFVKVLHLYEGNFTREDESRIKQYFRENDLVLFGDEYMKYCSEVLEFFDTYNTSEKLRNKINTIPYKQSTRYYKVNYHYIEYIISRIYPDLTELLDLQDKRDEIFKILRMYKEKEQLTYIKTEYGITENELVNYISKIITNPTPRSCELVEEFNHYGDTTSKLRLMVKISEDKTLTKSDVNSFLEMIPPRYKDYYTIVGPKIIKACGCFECEVKKRWRKETEGDDYNEQVISRMTDLFRIGYRYSKSSIKNTLKNLYQELEYKRAAKATDLEIIYVLKDVKIQEGNKWINGFEILGKRQ